MKSRLGVVILLLAALLAVAVGPVQGAQVAPALETPTIFPLRAVEPGMTAVVHTTLRGDKISTFGIRVVDVIKDGIAPGYDMILVRLTKRSRETVPGFFAGISGSPVYIGDRLLGAASYGFCCGDARYLGGITPAKYLLDLVAMRTPLPQRSAAAGMPAAASVGYGGMTPIATPLAVSGLRPERMPLVEQRFEQLMGAPVIMTRAGSAAPGDVPKPLRPGTPAAVVLAAGDFTFGAVGTTTLRAGNRVVAFGHPFLFEGAMRGGLASARVATVVRDQVLGPYVLASIGELSGSVVQDRMAGIVGVIGREMPSTVVRTDLRNRELGTHRVGGSVVAQRSALLSGLATTAALVGADATFNRIGSGSATAQWRVDGTRAGGVPFSYTREDLVDSPFDITYMVADPLWMVLDAIENNDFEAVRITEVGLTGTLSTRRRAATISEVAVTAPSVGEPTVTGPVFAQPGETLIVNVTLRRRRAEPTIKTLLVTVPEADGLLTLTVRGGDSGMAFEQEPPPGGPVEEPKSFDELLARLAEAPHRTDVVARLVSFDELTGSETEWSRAVATAKRVVSGERVFEVIVGTPPIEEPIEPEPAG